ncbi:MAG: 3-oxoacyl-ACP reductase FabG [Acidobacteria bacterium]|nr:3-oxoacyl-ACP reductase FabG [Acidobacteriota bacterium]
MKLEGDTALVTGGSSGIGRATAEKLAELGARVAINYRKNQAGAEAAVETIKKNGGEAFAVRADVAKAAEVERMVEAVRGKWGKIDILINNAGDLIRRTMLAEMTEEFWDLTMDLNFKSVFLCVKATWEEMRDRKSGIIINITSVAARNGGGPGAAAYAASKGGVLTYTKSLAKELAPHGIRVNAVAPGVIATPFHEKYSSAEQMERFRAMVPLGRIGTSEETADVVVFLACRESRYMAGETVEVNGGMLMD